MTIWHEIDTILDHAEKATSESEACTFSVPESFSGFRGHFPDNPILPGVVQLAIIRRFAERLLGESLFLVQVRRVKYLRVIQPNVPVTLSLVLETKYNCRHEHKSESSSLCIESLNKRETEVSEKSEVSELPDRFFHKKMYHATALFVNKEGQRISTANLTYRIQGETA